MESSRPSRESLHMATAFLWASRSEDPRLKVGAVVTTHDMRRVLSVGYNGLAKGRSSDEIRNTPGDSGCLHAEDNAIAMCDSTIPDKRMFVTHQPCEMCAQRIINAGFSHVYWNQFYRDQTGHSLLIDATIKTQLITPWFPKPYYDSIISKPKREE